jgi:glycosyltransferase involved in cell wall biosynthesis
MSTTFYPKIDGTTTAVADLITNLSARSHNVQLLTRRFKGTEQLEQWKGSQIFRVGTIKKSSLSRISLFMSQLIVGGLIVKRFRIDLIHTNSIVSLFAALIIRLFLHVPAVLTFNGSQRMWYPEARWQSNVAMSVALPLESFAMRHADCIFVQSRNLGAEITRLYGVDQQKIIVIPHPVDLDIFKPTTRQEDNVSPLILFVGTLGRIHGADLFVSSIAPVLEVFSDAKFVIVGSGPLKRVLDNMVSTANLGHSVEFLGSIYDRGELAELYKKCRVVVIPVRYPSRILTKVATEAMACAKPIVTTMELDKQLSNYGVFMTRVDPVNIADSIIKVLKMNDQNYEKVCLSARKYIEQNCSKDAVTDMLEKTYSSLIIHDH